MTLYTSYLGFFNRKDYPKFLRDHFPDGLSLLFVMLNRGNNVVSPFRELLDRRKSGKITWEEYRHGYLDHIGHQQGVLWMKNIGESALKNDVVLVCYEKDSAHCHRVLLAEAVAKWSGCEYKGELSSLLEETA